MNILSEEEFDKLSVSEKQVLISGLLGIAESKLQNTRENLKILVSVATNDNSLATEKVMSGIDQYANLQYELGKIVGLYDEINENAEKNTQAGE